MNSYSNLSFMLLLTIFGLGANTILAQEKIQHLSAARVTIDEDILAALVDEPCRHFEAARDHFVAGRFPQAAANLRTSTAYLRLEAARANAAGRARLEASRRELLDVAAATERGGLQSVDTLHQVFARAHYALASHHCVKSAHRCCRPATFDDQGEMRRAGQDLRAASIHLDRGLRWAGTDWDEETQRMLSMSELASLKLIRQDAGPQDEAQRLIHSIHGKLESLTGRKIMLARPLTPEDKTGPSIFR